MKLFGDNWTIEQWAAWLAKHPDDPEGCVACGAMAGCCKDYPNCPGNKDWKPSPQPQGEKP